MNQPLKKQNLILNSQWLPGPDGEPLYFTSTGTTGSQNCIAGHYTRCVSLNGLDSQKAEDRYDMPIEVRGVHGGITLSLIPISSCSAHRSCAPPLCYTTFCAHRARRS